MTSTLFAVFHIDIIGGFIFGLFTARVFLKTRQLWLVVIVHAAHNTVAWALAVVDVTLAGESFRTLIELQGTGWIGLTALLIGVPTVVVAWRRMPSSVASGATPAT